MTSRSLRFALFVASCVALFVACGGGAKVGETCATSGSVEECESGAVCTANGSDGAPVCLKVCTDASQCGSTEDCNGVDGSSQKACRPKTSKSGK